jgi:hypothetical protein
MGADQKQSQSAAPLAHKDHAIAAMEMSLDELVIWAVGTNDNPLRRYIADLEIKRRVARAQLDAAKAAKQSAYLTLASVVVALLIGVGSWVISAHR